MKEFILEEVLQQFWDSGQELPLVVYDADDLLWSLMRVVCARGGIDFRTATEVFSIRDNPKLTLAQQNYIIGAFADVEMFRNIKFFPGAADILKVCELGARAEINTNSFTMDIDTSKAVQMLAHIHGLRPEQIRSNIIDHSQAKKKPLSPETTILVEDSPHNVSLSPAPVNVMPTNIGWTHSPSAQLIMKDKCVVYQPDLVRINAFVYELVRLMMRR